MARFKVWYVDREEPDDNPENFITVLRAKQAAEIFIEEQGDDPPEGSFAVNVKDEDGFYETYNVRVEYRVDYSAEKV